MIVMMELTLSNLVRYNVDCHGVRRFAKMCKFSPSTISRITQGKKIDLKTYLRLCKYFNITKIIQP